MRLHESFLKRASEGPIDLLFLGDSITQGWNENPIWQRYYGSRKAANFGIGGDRTQHILWRLEHGELHEARPRVVVLMIGTNNVGSNPPGEIAAGVEGIVTAIRKKLPETKVLLLSVFPRGKSRMVEEDRTAREPLVDQINERIASLGERPGVTYLDISDGFLDEEGKVQKGLMPDFLHLSRKGYQIWAEAMEPTLWTLLEGK